VATKAQEIHERTTALMAEGLSRTDAFKQIAQADGIKYDSVRGAYYSAKLQAEGGSGSTRTRRRVTMPDDALADARASLERSIANIDKEIEAAEDRAAEMAREAKDLKASAAERKQAIQQRLEALK